MKGFMLKIFLVIILVLIYSVSHTSALNTTRGPVADASQLADRYHRPTAVLWVHGGGWTGGSPTDFPHPKFASWVVWDRDSHHIDVSYPLGPGAYPGNVQALQRVIDSSIGRYSRVVVVGYSAGGTLALLADTSKVTDVFTFGAPNLSALYHLQPNSRSAIDSVFGSNRPPQGFHSRHTVTVCGALDVDVPFDACETAGQRINLWTDHSFANQEVLRQILVS